MSLIIGRQIEFGVALEETRGTAETVAEQWQKKISANLTPRATTAIDESTRGRLEDSEKRRVTQKWVEGDVQGNVHADLIGYLLYNVFGAVVSSSLGSGVYSHVFSLLQNTCHPSLSLFVKDGDVDQFVVSGGMLSSLVIEAAPDAYVTGAASYIGRTFAANAASPSYNETQDFIGRDITVKVADTEGGLAGATPLKLKSLTVTHEPNTEANFVLGSYNPEDIYNKQWGLTVEFERDFIDTTFRDLYQGDSAKYMSIAIVGAANIGGGQNPSLTYVLNKVQVMDWNRTDSANDIVTETVTLKAFFNEDDSELGTATLVNNVSEYDTPISA